MSSLSDIPGCRRFLNGCEYDVDVEDDVEDEVGVGVEIGVGVEVEADVRFNFKPELVILSFSGVSLCGLYPTVCRPLLYTAI